MSTTGLHAGHGHRNAEALVAIQREMERYPSLKITMPHIADDDLLSAALQ